MKKEKYYYNLKTLRYEKIEVSSKRNFLRFLGFLSAALLTSFVLATMWSFFYDTPEEKILKTENKKLIEHNNLMDKELENIDKILAGLKQRDNNLYRVIFEADPIPSSISEVGIGGSSRYKDLKGYKNSDLMTHLNTRVDKIKRQLYLQSKSYDEIKKLVDNKEEMLQAIPAIQPISNKDLTRMASGYGMRIDPVYNVSKMHWGMDFTAPTGTEIYATGSGKVVESNYSNGGYGNRIKIDHGYGYQSLYAHMSSIAVKKGDKVTRGQVIGYVGNTGKSVGPHLHYEVIKNGNKINPVYFYYQDLNEESFEKMVELSANSGQSLD